MKRGVVGKEQKICAVNFPFDAQNPVKMCQIHVTDKTDLKARRISPAIKGFSKMDGKVLKREVSLRGAKADYNLTGSLKESWRRAAGRPHVIKEAGNETEQGGDRRCLW